MRSWPTSSAAPRRRAARAPSRASSCCAHGWEAEQLGPGGCHPQRGTLCLWSAAELAGAAGAEQRVELGRKLIADLGQLPLGDGLADDLDHRPRVKDGLRQVDAFAAGDPLEELVQAERVAAFWLLLQVPVELGRELGGQLVLEPPGQRLGQRLQRGPGGPFGVTAGS